MHRLVVALTISLFSLAVSCNFAISQVGDTFVARGEDFDSITASATLDGKTTLAELAKLMNCTSRVDRALGTSPTRTRSRTKSPTRSPSKSHTPSHSPTASKSGCPACPVCPTLTATGTAMPSTSTSPSTSASPSLTTSLSRSSTPTQSTGFCNVASDCHSTYPNSSPSCAANQCTFVCNVGYSDCDGNATNGCEIHISADVNHCGGCSAAPCSVSHGTAACSNGACVVVTPNELITLLLG